RNYHRTAGGKTKAVAADRRFLQWSGSEESAGIQRIIGEIFVCRSMQFVATRFRRVFDEPPAGMAVLRRIRGGNDLHLLNAFSRRGTLMALLVTDRIPEGGAVEEVLGGHGLPTVDP